MFLGKVLVFGLALLCALAVSVGQLGLFAGTAPTDLGVRDGRLKPPSLTENSVSSQSGLYPDHPQRDYAAMAPLALRGDGFATLAAIKTIVEGTAGAAVVKSEPGYLYAQYTSKWLRFVDDVEFWFDPLAGGIQVRSASRVGRSDLGVNRKRIEEVRAALAARS
jgi:uncharacterized protein (DUF1499 family)